MHVNQPTDLMEAQRWLALSMHELSIHLHGLWLITDVHLAINTSTNSCMMRNFF